MDKYLEIHTYIQGTLGRLYCVIFQPKKANRKKGFIILHPFGEEKKSAHRFLVELSKLLANEGFNVLMYDFYGLGDSEGKMYHANISVWINDLELMHNYFRNKQYINDISIIGLRFGAYIGLLYAIENRINITSLILLEPVIDGMKYFDKILRGKYIKEFHTIGKITSNNATLFKQLDDLGHIDLDGFSISKIFFNELKNSQSKIDYSKLGTKEIIIFRISIIEKLTAEINEFIREVNVFDDKSIRVKMIKSLSFWEKIDPMSFEGINDQIIKVIITDKN